MSTTDVNCVPGERLGSTDECEAGRGTYVRKSFIYASRSALELLKIGLQRFLKNWKGQKYCR